MPQVASQELAMFDRILYAKDNHSRGLDFFLSHGSKHTLNPPSWVIQTGSRRYHDPANAQYQRSMSINIIRGSSDCMDRLIRIMISNARLSWILVITLIIDVNADHSNSGFHRHMSHSSRPYHMHTQFVSWLRRYSWVVHCYLAVVTFDTCSDYP